jgi:hypothetical protein
MKTCTHCGTHVRTSACTCPHCGERAACSRARTPAVALLGLALAACGGDGADTADTAVEDDPVMQPDYGVPDTDEDGDGYGVDSGDCDDADADVHPGATETPGDGVDSNCDGSDDT